MRAGRGETQKRVIVGFAPWGHAADSADAHKHGISGSFRRSKFLRTVAVETPFPMPKIYIIHENDTWVEPLRAAFAALGEPYEEWFLSDGLVDLTQPPPEGIFYNRMSASSHTRGHRYAPELTAAVLAWLEMHGRRVVNDSRALQLEISKVAQYAALSRHGIRTP